MNTVDLSVFEGKTAVERFSAASEYLRNNPGSTLVIPSGEYLVSGELAREAQRKLLGGEFGYNPQPVMFNPDYKYDRGLDLTGVRDAKVVANGVTLMVDGYMEPVTVANCENLEIIGLTIDHVRKPFSRGTVTEVCPCGELIKIRVRLDRGNEVGPRTPNMLRHLLLDPETEKSVVIHVKGYDLVGENELLFYIKEIKKDEEQSRVREGMLFYTWHSCHSRPGILLENSKDIVLRDITIHSQPGMGIVGNRCENVRISGLRVVPSRGDHVSTISDATHFTSCKGDLIFEKCEAAWQGDDFTNVHAYYQAVIDRCGEKTYLIREKTPDGTHAQSLDYPDEGDTLELVSHKTLEKLGEYRVVSCTPMAKEWMCRVELDRPLPEDTRGLMLADITRLPNVVVRGCRMRSHFARSILLKNRSALVENCVFEDVQGPAVVAAAESWWYEGVCPANITVRNNRFINCASFWGEASAVVVKADSEFAEGQSIFNITVENNVIESPVCEHGIFIRNTSGLVVQGNTIASTGECVKIENCENAAVKNF